MFCYDEVQYPATRISGEIMMSIRPLIAFVLFVCLLMACQASPVPAPSPTAVAVAVATSPTAVAQPTLAPTVTAEPPSTPEPAATATISLTAEITTTTLMTGTEVISGTIEINEQQFTLDQIKAFATDSGLTAEEVARITSIEAAEGNQILALDTSGAVVAKFTVNAEGELGVEESFSASDTIMEQLGAGIPNNLGKIYHSDEHNITIYAQNPFSSTHSIESNSPVLPENYINALGQIRANLANGFRAVDIITGEITLWTTEKLVAAGIDTSETQIIAVSTADIPLPTLTLRSSGENFHLGSLSQTREAMFADIRNQVNGQTGQKWRTQVNAYFSPTENIYFLVENTKSLTDRKSVV